ncbi:cysteine desulfurase CsdA [Thorsellia anophelis]|uniref:cysteine desulfurase n=1 Tax=Thorsellia anophelis DSM 18579 TaxID=1123402 RepID=A0A1I0BC87_9GAMM|nr:cysteine desulfurase CsdA [Thorsellia anophelis]SET04429.1 cysteine desulfurase [Thorsellia anophelis DSM 18579]
MSRTLIESFRAQFPAISPDHIYLDSAATALKPKAMIEATLNFYQGTGNIHRSQYSQALQLTNQYEHARSLAANFIHAAESHSIIWTKGATEAVNLIASSYLEHKLTVDDEIIVSESEHHANLIPWIMLAKKKQAKIIPLPLNNSLVPDLNILPSLISNKTKLIAITQMSNVTGAVTDIHLASSIAHSHNCAIAVDGSQGIVHHGFDVSHTEVDFYFFSAHKLYGPTGVGVLYIHPDRIDEMYPWQGGGKMLSHAKMDDFIAEDAPYCFEAGTPNTAGIIGFGATLNWLKDWPLDILERHASDLAQCADDRLSQLVGYKKISVDNSSILTFIIKGIHSNDLAILLSEQNIAVRSGLHCAHPLNKVLGINGSIRASFAPFNTLDETYRFCGAVEKAVSMLA